MNKVTIGSTVIVNGTAREVVGTSKTAAGAVFVQVKLENGFLWVAPVHYQVAEFAR